MPGMLGMETPLGSCGLIGAYGSLPKKGDDGALGARGLDPEKGELGAFGAFGEIRGLSCSHALATAAAKMATAKLFILI